MICGIATPKEAKEVMDNALMAHGTLKFEWFHPLIFDLDESVDPNDVETKIVECMTCNLTIHSKLGGNYIDFCPHCGSRYFQTKVEVFLVIQGSVVVYSAWRKPETSECPNSHLPRDECEDCPNQGRCP